MYTDRPNIHTIKLIYTKPLTQHIQMHPRPILRRIRRPIQEIHLTLIPALVSLPNSGQIQRCQATERRPTFVPLPRVRGVPVVPDVDGDLDVLLLPLYDVGYRGTLGEGEGTGEDDILTEKGGCVLGFQLCYT